MPKKPNRDDLEQARKFWTPRLTLRQQLRAMAFDALSLGVHKAAFSEMAHGAYERAESEIEQTSRAACEEMAEDDELVEDRGKLYS